MDKHTVTCRHVFTIIILLFLSFLVNPCVVSAQFITYDRLEIPSSFNPVGSGARAIGMGGAFIAIADDATAASWNPGGLIQLETPEVSFVGAYFTRTEDLHFGTNPEASGSENVTDRNVNYLSAAYPFTWLKRNMIVSVNYQHLFDLYRDWDVTLNQEYVDFIGEHTLSQYSEGSLSALAIAYCLQVTPKISLGMTLNFWEDGLYENQWETENINTWTGISDGVVFNEKTIDHSKNEFSGFNYNLGFLWTMSYRITLGFVFKAPFTADLKRYGEEFDFIDDMEAPVYFEESSEDIELDMPMSYGVGLSYRFSDELTAALDIYRTEWDDFILTDENGNKSSPISLLSENESDIQPTTQIRFGAEYLFIGDRYIIPVRGGCFYDPAPAEGAPDDYYGFSVGSGFARGKIVFDLAYQYRFGNNVADYILEQLDFSHDVREHTIYSSIIYHF